jgi:hypothetical protein
VVSHSFAYLAKLKEDLFTVTESLFLYGTGTYSAVSQ